MSFIKMKDGSKIRADIITAVRIVNDIKTEPNYKPRVVVDFGNNSNYNCIITFCKTVEECYALSDSIMADLVRLSKRTGMRKVIVSEMRNEPGSLKWKLADKGEAIFHSFGVNYQEFESGPGNYTVAIVEWPSGQIELVCADRIRFVTPSAVIEDA